METSVPFGTAVELLIYVFIALAMLCIGLSATVGEMLALLRDGTRVTRVIVANIVIPPVVALALVAGIG